LAMIESGSRRTAPTDTASVNVHNHNLNIVYMTDIATIYKLRNDRHTAKRKIVKTTMLKI